MTTTGLGAAIMDGGINGCVGAATGLAGWDTGCLGAAVEAGGADTGGGGGLDMGGGICCGTGPPFLGAKGPIFSLSSSGLKWF